MPILPDVLAPGLDVVFCGSAAGAASAAAKAYYAGPGNRFWPTLCEIGLTARKLESQEYPLLLSYGLGLTDLNQTESGGDAALSASADDGPGLRDKIERFHPAFLAFNGKRAAQAFLGHAVRFGRQPETIGETAIYVMPSTSGSARGHWDLGPWQQLADHVSQRKRFARDALPDLERLSDEAREEMRANLNRRVYHRIGLDLGKMRDEDERASRMTSPTEAAREAAIMTETAAAFHAAHAGWIPALADAAAVVRDFFVVYDERAVRDNAGGIKFADSFWLYFLARLLAPDFIVESGTHKGHSSWLLRRACPDAEIHCFDVSFRNLEWRDPGNLYHETDWMEAEFTAPEGARTLCYFDDHISHAQRIAEAHARGFRTLLFNDDFPARLLHATGHPPAPTLAMIFDETLEDGYKLEWLRHGKPRSFVFDAAKAAAGRAAVAHYAKTPDLGPKLRARPQSGIAVAVLNP
jgi:TDG/mug DNA glycosylase family protein